MIIRFLSGGGQHVGEALSTTVNPEACEVTGLAVTPERLLWLREYIGAHHGGAREDQRVEAIALCRTQDVPGKLGGPARDDVQTGLMGGAGEATQPQAAVPGPAGSDH
ncbi:hypothetical protein ABZ782_01520 [Streptomyces asoensis]|uniref:hypothetical protein n=1 Tax=Streptomyces asoensis TaxID=249586 RepID=UPI0033F183EE